MEGMQVALGWARKGFEAQEVPVGAALFIKGKLIVAAHNRVESHRSCLDHAELLVLKEALGRLRCKYLDQADLYVTLEPCPLCAAAIRLSRIRRLYFAAYDPKGGGVEHGPCLLKNTSTEVVGGLCEKESSLLLKAFFSDKRNPKNAIKYPQ